MASPLTAFPALSMRLGAALLAVAAGFAGGYGYGRNNAPETTRIVTTACGVAPAAAPFFLPIGVLGEHAPDLPVMVGPVKVDGGTTVLLRFDPAVDGTGDTVVRVGDVLHLPGSFGERPAPPTEIRLNCRNGVLAAVQYHLDDVAARFTVVHRADDGAAPGS
ncbi:hypothetical protein SAE02_70470 [Skermanella aerolata]|uniref:Uncharacterized protein n=1 Tax=Skermanella aerolata TaxID=393310 RepID=A0A512E2E1_9PROT|nr:hypothetical protein [Skermanella aerolata]KJB91388.1 hypothetical protein N826_30555 [Skermanella aerolata KACC 11604]GEO42899.1 hypothetical protein SAE02_70470 [Skermanella aerolata]